MRKIQAITATNYDCDDVEAAMMNRSEIFAVMFAKAREQTHEFNKKKVLPTPIIEDPAFASILKGTRNQGTEALTKKCHHRKIQWRLMQHQMINHHTIINQAAPRAITTR